MIHQPCWQPGRWLKGLQFWKPEQVAGAFEEPPVERTKLTCMVMVVMMINMATMMEINSVGDQLSPGGVTAASKIFTLSGSGQKRKDHRLILFLVLKKDDVPDKLMTYWLCVLASCQKKAPSNSAWTQFPHRLPPGWQSCPGFPGFPSGFHLSQQLQHFPPNTCSSIQSARQEVHLDFVPPFQELFPGNKNVYHWHWRASWNRGWEPWLGRRGWKPSSPLLQPNLGNQIQQTSERGS